MAVLGHKVGKCLPGVLNRCSWANGSVLHRKVAFAVVGRRYGAGADLSKMWLFGALGARKRRDISINF